MADISLETLFDLLGTTDLPGSEPEREALCRRIGELLDLNGADWVRGKREMLIEQWRCIVAMRTIR